MSQIGLLWEVALQRAGVDDCGLCGWLALDLLYLTTCSSSLL
jgi:hypothetical protein